MVGTQDNIVIAGFLLSNSGALDQVIVRGIGPSLAPGSAERAPPHFLILPQRAARDAPVGFQLA